MEMARSDYGRICGKVNLPIFGKYSFSNPSHIQDAVTPKAPNPDLGLADV